MIIILSSHKDAEKELFEGKVESGNESFDNLKLNENNNVEKFSFYLSQHDNFHTDNFSLFMKLNFSIL